MQIMLSLNIYFVLVIIKITSFDVSATSSNLSRQFPKVGTDDPFN